MYWILSAENQLPADRPFERVGLGDWECLISVFFIQFPDPSSRRFHLAAG